MILISLEEAKALKTVCDAFLQWKNSEQELLPPVPVNNKNNLEIYLDELLEWDAIEEVRAFRREENRRAEKIVKVPYTAFCNRLESFGIPKILGTTTFPVFTTYFGPWSPEISNVAANMYDSRNGDLSYAELKVESLSEAMAEAIKFCGYKAFEDLDKIGRSLMRRRLKQVVANIHHRDNRSYVLRLYRLFTYALSEALAGVQTDLDIPKSTPKKHIASGRAVENEILNGTIKVDWYVDPDSAMQMLTDYPLELSSDPSSSEE